jgi:hypothetical protein
MKATARQCPDMSKLTDYLDSRILCVIVSNAAFKLRERSKVGWPELIEV